MGSLRKFALEPRAHAKFQLRASKQTERIYDLSNKYIQHSHFVRSWEVLSPRFVRSHAYATILLDYSI